MNYDSIWDIVIIPVFWSVFTLVILFIVWLIRLVIGLFS